MVYSYIENDMEHSDGELFIIQDKLLNKIINRFICLFCMTCDYTCENKDLFRYITYNISKNAILLNIETIGYYYTTIVGESLDFQYIKNYFENYMQNIYDEKNFNICEEFKY